MQKHILSKSSFLKGLQCEKALYLSKFHRELKDDLSAQKEAIFAQGNNVGQLSQRLFPGGIDCSPETVFDFQQAVLRTKDEIENGATIIYEAAFQFNEVLVALDILVKDEEGWKAYEVKSSTSVSNIYELDASVQYYTITNSGIELKDISIVHINNQYVKNGEIDVSQLFNIVSVKEKVMEILPKLPEQIDYLKNILKQKEIPNKEIGSHCSSPYQCDFVGHCWKEIPDYSVFDISRLKTEKKFQLYKNGILHLKDIPEEFPLSAQQKMQVHAEKSNETIINKPAIRNFINQLNFPLYYLDFETFANAIPVLDNSRPYQQLVFQYSLHIENQNEKVDHYEYLAEIDGSDPREKFVNQLIKDCGKSGDIIVYNIGFEKSKIAELSKLYPQFQEELNNIIDRLVDLMIPFQNKWYYTPEMKGSYSIKKVLPALVPELSYSNLEISEGGTASNTFAEMFSGEFSGDIAKTRHDLLEYCKLDTFAMVEIMKRLRKV
jgi:predicted RecB family nuclease